MKTLRSNAAVALGFLTRLPVPIPNDLPRDALGRAAGWFGLVGVLVGVVSGAVWATALIAGLPPWPAAVVALAAQLLLTGALHEDGLADVADALGARSRERALEIMRDSRIGTYGTLALGLSLMARVGALAAMGLVDGVFALVLAHSAGRGAIVVSLVTMPYARPEGLASGAATASGGATVIFALAPALFVGVLVGPLAGMLALAGGALVWVLISRFLLKRFGGYTGDGLGTTEQGVEIAVLLTLAAQWA